MSASGLWHRLQSKQFFVHYLNSTQRFTFKFRTHDLHNMPMVHVIFRYILVGLQKGLTTFKFFFLSQKPCWVYQSLPHRVGYTCIFLHHDLTDSCQAKIKKTKNENKTVFIPNNGGGANSPPPPPPPRMQPAPSLLLKACQGNMLTFLRKEFNDRFNSLCTKRYLRFK